MDTNASPEKKLNFLKRMTWWLPVLVFAIWSSVMVALGPLNAGMSIASVVLQAFIAAVVVGVLVTAVYFGYKYVLERNPSL